MRTTQRKTKTGSGGTTKPSKLDTGVLPQLVGFQIRRAQVAVYADFMRGSPVPGLTPGQTGVLILIDRNPQITQQRLCDEIRVEKSTLVVLLHKLTQLGLIRRVRSTRDRRENSLQLTAKGSAALKAILAHIARHEARVFAKLSAAERKQLVALLQRLR